MFMYQMILLRVNLYVYIRLVLKRVCNPGMRG
jgi:hypothetical protein